MIVTRLAVGMLDTNCWLVAADESGPLVVIDPGDDAELVLDAVGGREVAAVVLTHGHFDHLGAVDAVVAATDAPLMVHADDAHRLASSEPHMTGGSLFGFDDHISGPADRMLVDGDTIEAGELMLTVLHTPGHTPGCISLYAAAEYGGVPHLFSGDTVFAGSVGRTDFPGGDARQLSRSIAEKIAPLPPETAVHPGHGPDTTIGREARINPFWPRA